MQDSLKVARWEFKKMIKSKTFIILTFFLPLVILLIGGVVGYFSTRDGRTEHLKIGIIDQTNQLELRIKHSLEAEGYEVEIYDHTQTEINKAFMNRKQLDGLLVIPADVLRDNEVSYYFNDLQALEENLLQNVVSSAVNNQRLQAHGYEPIEINKLIKDVRIEATTLQNNDNRGNNTIVNMFLPFGLAMMMVFASMFSGGALLQSIIKEKGNRIVELILSSISARSLMTGKVIGYGLLGIIQVLIWSVAGLFAVKYFLGVNIYTLLNLKTFYMLIYFALGFVMVASINAIVGSGMKEAQSGSQSTGILILIPIIPIYFSGAIIKSPAGIVSKILSYIPFTSPTTMLIRLGFSSPSIIEIIGTVLLLLVANYFMIRLAAKIFRVGMLMYGKNANFKELIRWAKSKDY